MEMDHASRQGWVHEIAKINNRLNQAVIAPQVRQQPAAWPGQ